MISQFRGYLKLRNYFLMLMILTASVHSGLQLYRDMSDSIQVFAGIVFREPGLIPSKPKSSFQLVLASIFTTDVYSSL